MSEIRRKQRRQNSEHLASARVRRTESYVASSLPRGEDGEPTRDARHQDGSHAPRGSNAVGGKWYQRDCDRRHVDLRKPKPLSPRRMAKNRTFVLIKSKLGTASLLHTLRPSSDRFVSFPMLTLQARLSLAIVSVSYVLLRACLSLTGMSVPYECVCPLRGCLSHDNMRLILSIISITNARRTASLATEMIDKTLCI
jgi:hypothetical protein